MLLFHDEEGGDLKEVALEMQSNLKASRIHFINVLVNIWQLIVQKFSLSSDQSGTGKSTSTFTFPTPPSLEPEPPKSSNKPKVRVIYQMESNNPYEILDDDDGFDWEAAAREIDAVCQMRSGAKTNESELEKVRQKHEKKKREASVILSDGDNIDKIGRIDRSPEVHMRGNGDLPFVLEQTSYMRSEREKFGDKKWNDWDQILQRFSTSTKQLHSPSFVKLNLRSIGMLEDVLVNLQKVKKWDILSSEIHSQKFADPQNTQHKRVVEVKMLLFNIAYEKAKLQLMNVKRDRLLKKAQQLSSGLQETQMIKNSMLCSAKSGPVDIQADDSHINARLFNSQGKCQVSYEKRMEMRQELESLDQKAKSLSEFFYSHCKMEGDQSCTNILKSVPDYLEKRMSYKLVFRKVKLWDIEDFERKDDYHLTTLNYHGYIIQRFTVNAGLSRIIVSNSLNDVNIGKTYPNRDAFSAFLFALNPLTTSKCTGQISMAQQGGLQQMVSSASQAPMDDCVERVDSGPQGPQITQHAISGVGKVGSAMESKNGDSRQTRAWKGKAHGSWRQRNSTESNDVHDMQDGGNNESDSYQNIQIPMECQQVQKMSETSLLRGHSKHANDNHDSSVLVSSPITKDHKAVVRDRQLPFRRQKGTWVNHDTDQKKNVGDTRKESLLSSSDHNQQDLNAVSTESQSTEERMSSHWQPKFQASNNQRGNRHKKKESTYTGISFRDGQDTEYSAIVPPPSQSVSEKGWGDDDWNLETVRESRNAPPKGHLHSNQVAVSSSELAPTGMDFRHKQRPSSDVRRNGNQNHF